MHAPYCGLLPALPPYLLPPRLTPPNCRQTSFNPRASVTPLTLPLDSYVVSSVLPCLFIHVLEPRLCDCRRCGLEAPPLTAGDAAWGLSREKTPNPGPKKEQPPQATRNQHNQPLQFDTLPAHRTTNLYGTLTYVQHRYTPANTASHTSHKLAQNHIHHTD